MGENVITLVWKILSVTT